MVFDIIFTVIEIPSVVVSATITVYLAVYSIVERNN